MAARAAGIGRLGGGARFLLEYAHHGVDRRIDLVQAAQHRIDRVARRGLAGADEAREVGRVVLPELHEFLSPLSSRAQRRTSSPLATGMRSFAALRMTVGP